MAQIYTAHVNLKVRKTDINAQIIDIFLLEIYSIVTAIFQVFEKLGCYWFFNKTFLSAQIIIKVVFSMFFINFSNSNVYFAKKKLTWRIYIIKKVLASN